MTHPPPHSPRHVAPPDFASWPPARRDEWFTTAYKEIVAAEQGERESLSSSTTGYGSREALRSSAIRVADGAPSEAKEFQPAYTRGLVALTGAQLLQRDFPPRQMVLAPFLPEKGLVMIFAERGIGKTWVALNIAHAVAGAGAYLRWSAAASRRVVYIDGEMPAAVLKDRYAAIVAGASFDAPDDNFRLVAADLQPDGLPDLADPAAQQFYDGVIADADLIIIDNLSTVCRALRENEADSWGPVQGWCIRQRAAGRSVLLIHHAGKGGSQRGTSRKEDVLDSVVSLKRPIDYDAAQGARFEVHFTKSRGFLGDDAAPFEAQLVDGVWRTGDIVAADDEDAIVSLKASGATVREIAERTGVPRSTVADRLKRARP